MKRSYEDISPSAAVWYYNATIRNVSKVADGTVAPANFSESNAVPLLTSCEGWKVALARLSVTGASAQLPIFEPLMAGDATDPDKTAYSITLAITNANDVPVASSRVFCRWFPQNKKASRADPAYYFAQDYQWVTNMINDALVRATTQLLDTPALSAMQKPAFSYVRSWDTIDTYRNSGIVVKAGENTVQITLQVVGGTGVKNNGFFTVAAGKYSTVAALCTALQAGMAAGDNVFKSVSPGYLPTYVVTPVTRDDGLAGISISVSAATAGGANFPWNGAGGTLRTWELVLDFGTATHLAAQLGVESVIVKPETYTPVVSPTAAVFNSSKKQFGPTRITTDFGSYAYMDFDCGTYTAALHLDPAIFVHSSTLNPLPFRARLYFNENLRNLLPFDCVRNSAVDGSNGETFCLDTVTSASYFDAGEQSTVYNRNTTAAASLAELVVQQPYSSTSSWPPFTGLALTSQQIPGVPESSGLSLTGDASNAAGTALNTSPVLFDLDFISAYAHDACAGISFTPSQYRFANLKSAPLSGVDFRLMLKRRDGTYTEWDTSDNGVISAKFMFVRE